MSVNMKKTCEILVSGGGIAGLTAAAAFGTAGFDVLCVDPAQPITTRSAPGADLRTTAILQPGRQTLETAGIWQRLASHAAPLETMRIIDAGGPEPAIRVIKDFRAAEVSDLPFGWNLPNWVLRREILARLEDLPNVTFRAGLATTGYLGRGAAARVRLSDGSTCAAKLIIAADGRDSPMRQAAGIDVRRSTYGQKAIAFAVTHAQLHYNISSEIHRTGGPFTLVPLPDQDGSHASAVVWMDSGPAQAKRMAMSEPEFETEMNIRACSVLGPLKLAAPRSLWPIISQRATRLTAQRLALIAEAAHVSPPIGAQGLNMSLEDIAVLLEKTRKSNDPGDPQSLQAFERARLPDIRMRIGGIDLLNRASQSTAPLLRNARAAALEALYAATPVRKGLMRLGLGTR